MTTADATLALPAFWDGAAAARAELGRRDLSPITEHGRIRALRIATALRAGRPLADILEYAEWRAAGNYGHLRGLRDDDRG